ncbi:MAG TPA: cytochrome c [Bryobacteraceae bacterium]|nr:cytochrome c [Bryobacteraceae bacterium]
MGLLLLTGAVAGAASVPPWENRSRRVRDLFLEYCSVCHELYKPKSSKIGPSLARFKKLPPERARPFRAYIMTFIRGGTSNMPAFGRILTEEEMQLLADYLLTAP